MTHEVDLILAVTGATSLTSSQPLQTLWGGYGQISRLQLQGGQMPSLVLKRVCPPPQRPARESAHSHQRKLRSYAVEQAFYNDWAPACEGICRVPRCYLATAQGTEQLLLLEDLDAAGFSARCRHPNLERQDQVLHWLARFHAHFLAQAPTGLWPEGSYWHLQTRRQEWRTMAAGALKNQAEILDQRLRTGHFRTLIHGDAKPANFCFGTAAVAAVDFQYAGGGCGMRDVAYFLSCCAEAMDQHPADWVEARLEVYFSALRAALSGGPFATQLRALETEWRECFPVAWLDLERFLLGWSAASAPLSAYSQRLLKTLK